MPLFTRKKFVYQYTPNSNRLLDIGCSYGDFTYILSKKTRETYAIDYDPQLITRAKKDYPRIHFTARPSEHLPYPSRYFDTVVISDTLEHVTSDKKTAKEITRVLKKDGTLILSVPHAGLFACIDSFNLKFYFPRIYKLWKGKHYRQDIYTIAPWHRHYTLQQLINLFGKHFIITKKHQGGLFIFPLIWVFHDAIIWKFPKLHFLSSLTQRIADLDYSINYGSLGWHICLQMKKK